MIQDKKSHMANVNRTYRHRLKVYDWVDTEDSLGKMDQVLMEVGSFFADIKPIRGRELTQSELNISEVTYRITSYYNPLLASDMYLGWEVENDVTFLQVEAILDVSGREMHMEIMAKEVERPSGI